MRDIKRFTVVICSLAAALSIAACGSGSNNSTITSTTVETPTLNTETKAATAKDSGTIAVPATGIERKGTGYTLTFPSGWEETSSEGCDMVMYSTTTTSSFNTNINVTIEDVSAYGSAITVETYCEAAKGQLAKSSGFTVTGTQKCTVNGNDAYTLTCDAVQSGISYKCKQLYVVSGGNAYVVTFSAGVDGGYEKDIAEGDSIFASFKISK